MIDQHKIKSSTDTPEFMLLEGRLELLVSSIISSATS